jgi:hypothetical protein
MNEQAINIAIFAVSFFAVIVALFGIFRNDIP